MSFLTINQVEMMALDVLQNDPDAAAEFSLILREFMVQVARLIAETVGVADIDTFVGDTLDRLDE